MERSFENILAVLRETLISVLDSIVEFIPSLFGALVILGLGFLAAWVGSAITRRLIRLTHAEKIIESTPLKGLATSVGFIRSFGAIFGKLVYWTIFLVFLSTACKIVGLYDVADVISNIFGFIPSIVGAVIILILGSYIARILHDTIEALLAHTKVAYSNVLADGAEIVANVFVVIAVLNQLSFETGIITSNINIIISGVALAFAISVGIGSRNIVRDIIAMRINRRMIRENLHLKMPNISGKITEIKTTGIFVIDDDGNKHWVNGNELLENFTIEAETGLDV